jgi:hypothetical protein
MPVEKAVRKGYKFAVVDQAGEVVLFTARLEIAVRVNQRNPGSCIVNLES